MKKLLAVLLLLAMALSLFGCAAPGGEVTTLPTGSEPSQSVQATAPTEKPTIPTTVLPTAPTEKPTIPTTALPTAPTTTTPSLPPIDEDGHYNSKEDVALYIYTYGRLPENYVTKSYAQNVLGCKTSQVQNYWPDGAIGGDVFYNREGLLPSAPGRIWTECDINTWGKYARGAERIVFSNDGLIYYTSDHYRSFVLLYGEP